MLPSLPPAPSHGWPWRALLALVRASAHPCPCSWPLPVQEFVAATLSQHQFEKAENMRAAFLHFDKDNSGTISREELREALKVGRAGRGIFWATRHVWHWQLGGWAVPVRGGAPCCRGLVPPSGRARPTRPAPNPPLQSSFAGSMDSEVEIERILKESDKNGGWGV